MCERCKFLEGQLQTLIEKYNVICATCDHLWQRLQYGAELVDQLMPVIEINRRLEIENECLKALVQGTEPPRHDDCKN